MMPRFSLGGGPLLPFGSEPRPRFWPWLLCLFGLHQWRQERIDTPPYVYLRCNYCPKRRE